MAFTGPYPTKFSGHTSAMVISATTFSGGVTNAGTIGAGGVTITSSTFLTGGFLNSNLISGGLTGIAVRSDSTIHGAISDTGRILATDFGILVSGGIISGGIQVAAGGKIAASAMIGIGIKVESTSTFAGGIGNAGTISAGESGIDVSHVTIFSGSILNSKGGTISGGTFAGIDLDTISTFAGGINNSGTIAAPKFGIQVTGVTTFAGTVLNSGTITTKSDVGILLSNVTVFGTNGSGGITNAGRILGASATGIELSSVTTFAGGIANSGTISAGASNDGIFVDNASIFSGGIRNNSSGRITAGSSGIEVKLVTTFAGSISNAGTISTGNVSRVGIYLSKDAVFGSNSAGGGITNTGTIFSTAGAGIDLVNVATVLGSIVNSSSGKIVAGHGGIDVTNGTVFGAGSTAGGITNNGTISAGNSGIFVSTRTFLGAISNSGKIASKSGNGIAVTKGSVFGESGAGGIVNTGAISAKKTGIAVNNVTTFWGGISNNGTISAGSAIFVLNVASFAGGISNRGALVVVGSGGGGSKSGIGIQGASVFSGGIANVGTIRAIAAGIGLFSVSTFAGSITNSKGGTISAGRIGIEVGFTANGFPVSSFVGNIVNSGTITAKTGIALTDSTITGAIVDSGTIKATSHGILIRSGAAILAGKTAIEIAGPTFTGGISNFGVVSGSAGIEIKTAHPVNIFDAGAIVGTGGTAIEFAGSGNTLTLGAGYVISGIVDPSGRNTLQLGGTGSASFDLTSIGSSGQYRGFTTFEVVGGIWTVSGGGTATSGWHVDGGTMQLASGTVLTSTTVSGGTLVVESGAVAKVALVEAGGVEAIASGGFVSSATVKAGGTELFAPGGTMSRVTVSAGATLELVGGTAIPPGVALASGAILAFASGAVLSGNTVSGSTIIEVLAGGTDLSATVISGGTLLVGPGGFASGTAVGKGGVEKVLFGGVASDTNVSSGGALVVSSGGTADPTTVLSGGAETVSAHGTDFGAEVSGGGKLFIQSGGTAIDITIFSGGSAINSAGGNLDVVVSATDSGVLVNSGAVNVRNGATLTLGAATLNNAGSINLLGSSSQTTLVIDHSVTLSGGGTVSMFGGSSLITDSGGSHTLTNVNDKIVGGGGLGGDPSLFVINEAGGVIDGNGSGSVGQLDISATVTNAGLIEGTTSQGLAIGGSGLITNSGTIAALGTGALTQIVGVTVADSTTKALILASGSGAEVELGEFEFSSRATISGGALKTSAGGEIAVGYAALIGVGIAASSLIDVDTAGGVVTLNGGTIGTGAIIETTNTDGGDIFVTGGTVTNGGTLFANSAGTELVIFAGAVVNGGVALIGDGLVEIEGSSGESVKFLSNGSGGLQIDDDAAGRASAFSGRVSGFGGSGHSNQTQFIALTGVTSGAGITSSYVPGNAGNTSGTLFVSSGGTLVAAIKMAGSYSAGDFHITAGIFGTVAITDPGVVNGGSVQTSAGSTFPRPGIDLPDIAFGAQTTLAYSQDPTDAGGTLTVSDGRHAAAIAVLGNYMAGSLVAVADGHGGTLITEANPQQQPLLLTHPPHG